MKKTNDINDNEKDGLTLSDHFFYKASKFEQLENVLGSIGDGIIITDDSGHIKFLNKTAQELTGWSNNEAFDASFDEIFKLINKETGEPQESLFLRTVSEKTKIGLKKSTVLISKDGKEYYISASSAPIISENDKISGIVVVFRDVTRVRKIELELENEQKNLKKIFDLSPISMIIVDENIKILNANETFIKNFNLNKDDIFNKNIGNVLKCENIDYEVQVCGEGVLCGNCELRTAVEHALNNDVSVKNLELKRVFYSFGEQEEYIRVIAEPLVINEKKHVIVALDDITNYIKLQEYLKKSRDYYKSLFENFPAMIWISDTEKKCTYFNMKWLEFTGRTLEQEYGDGWVAGVHPEDVKYCYNTFSEAFDKRETFEMEYRLRANDGEYKWLLDIARPMYDIENKFIGYLGVCFDISEIKKLNEELRKAKETAELASHAKSIFLATMSHEIRTPLNGLIGMIDLTLFKEEDKSQRENLIIAKDCAYSLLNLINDILDYSKLEVNKVILENIDFDLKKVVESTLMGHKINAQNKGLYFKFSYDEAIPKKVKGDPERLKQVINNIVGNAVKFTETGGIIVKVNLDYVKMQKTKIKFIVEDTGIGIEESNMDKLFKLFTQIDSSYTRKYGGTGLGLAISKRLVEMMGGRINVKSQIGKGSIFEFGILFGLAEGELEGKQYRRIEEIKVKDMELKILVAEDDKVNQTIICKMLNNRGYNCLVAENGKEALELYKKNSFDLVLMDINMPEIDGIEATKSIRQMDKEVGRYTPIVALTAYALKGDKEKFLALGMDDYLSKPYEMNTLYKVIERVVSKFNKKEEKCNVDMNKKGNDTEYLMNPCLEEQKCVDGNCKIKYDEGILHEIEYNLNILKKSVLEENLLFSKKFASAIKRLAEKINAEDLKRIAFKTEMVLRKESINEAEKYIEAIEKELFKIKDAFDKEIIKN